MTDSIAGQLDLSSGAAVKSAYFKHLPKRFVRWVSQANAYDLASACVLICLIGLVLWTFQDFSISNDEGLQNQYGELIIAYYKSGFTDKSLFKLDNLYLYGGLFDVSATLLSQIIPVDLYELRHLLCAIIGIGGIAFAGLTARWIVSPRAGFFAIAALALCGSWYGAMFNHTKGIPLATFMAGAIYFLLRASRNLPRPRMRDVLVS